MLGYDFEIIYRSRCENKAADALSRNPKFYEQELLAISTVQLVEAEEIQ